MKPLQGMKILDFTYLLPGPYATMLLADLGADVIKVEDPARPDMTRFIPPVKNGISALYAHLNRGKKSLMIDLKKPEAREIVYRLMEEYDVVIEQFRPGVMDKFGLGYNTLCEKKSSIIYCSLTGYGQTGEYAARAGHDINYCALSGLSSYSGRKEEGPSLSGLQIADIAGGSKNCVIGIEAAYIKRLRTGEGDFIDISITDSTFAMTLFSTAPWLAGGQEPQAEGEVLNGGFLYDYYQTGDGRYLSVGPIEEKFFKAFCIVIGYPELAEKGIGSREDKETISRIIAGKSLAEWTALFSRVDACVEPVRGLAEAVENPPLSEREMIVDIKSDEGHSFPQLGNPIKFGSGHYYADTPGVHPGKHNEEILKGAGYSRDEVSAFRKEGLFG